MEGTPITKTRSSALRGVALTRVISDPPAASIASRIRSPRPRGRSVRSTARKKAHRQWNRVTRGVWESASRGSCSPPPHHWRATPRLVDFPAGVRASEAGDLGDSARRSHSSRPRRRAVPVLRFQGLASIRQSPELVSGANEQRREKTGRSIARAAGREDKRSAQAVNAGSDLVS